MYVITRSHKQRHELQSSCSFPAHLSRGKLFHSIFILQSYNSCPINAITMVAIPTNQIQGTPIIGEDEEPTRSFNNDSLWAFQKVFLLLQKWWPRVSSHQSATQTRTGPRGRRGCEIQYKQAILEKKNFAEVYWKMLFFFFLPILDVIATVLRVDDSRKPSWIQWRTTFASISDSVVFNLPYIRLLS